MSKADADGMPQSEASGKSTLPPRAKPDEREHRRPQGEKRRATAANVPPRDVAHSRWSCLIGFGTSRDSTAAHRADEREHRRPQGEKRRATAANVPLRGVAHSRWSCLIGFCTNRDSTAAHRADEPEQK